MEIRDIERIRELQSDRQSLYKRLENINRTVLLMELESHEVPADENRRKRFISALDVVKSEAKELQTLFKMVHETYDALYKECASKYGESQTLEQFTRIV